MKSVKNKANSAAMSWCFSFQHNQTSASNNHAGFLKICTGRMVPVSRGVVLLSPPPLSSYLYAAIFKISLLIFETFIVHSLASMCQKQSWIHTFIFFGHCVRDVQLQYHLKLSDTWPHRKDANSYSYYYSQSTRNPNEQLIGHVLVNLKHIFVLKVFTMQRDFCHFFVQLFSNETLS